jgi:hypothetical protein
MQVRQYFIAQLPMYAFEAEVKDLMSKETFFALAAENLSRGDVAQLSKVDIATYAQKGLRNPMMKAYARFERALREELAEVRRSRKGEFEYKPTLFPAALLKDGNPLEIETRLLKFRWDKIDEMEFGHHFDLDIIIAFYLKLQLLYRKASFVRERGWEAFTRICAGKEKA